MNSLIKYLLLPLALVWLLIYKANLSLITTTDTQRYAILARNMVEKGTYSLGGLPELVFPPGISLLLVPLINVGLSNLQAVGILNSLAYISIPIFCYLIGRKCGQSGVGLLFGLVVVANGNTINLALISQMEIVWLSTVLFALYLLLNNLTVSLMFSGFFFGLGSMIRPETLAYEALFLVVLFFERFTFRKVMLVLIVTLLTIASYSYFLYKNTGKISLSGKVATIEWDRFVEDPEFLRDSKVYQLNVDGTIGTSLKNMSTKEIRWQERIKRNLKLVKQPLMELLLPAKLTGIAIVIAFLFERKRKRLLIEMLIVLPIFSILLFHVERRYLWPVMLLVLYWLVKNAFLVKRQEWGNRCVGLLSVITLYVVTYYSYWPVRADLPNFRGDKNKIISTLSKIPDSTETIISRKPDYSYYLDIDYRPLPYIESANQLSLFSKTIGNSELVILDDMSLGNMPVSHLNIKKSSIPNLDFTN